MVEKILYALLLLISFLFSLPRSFQPTVIFIFCIIWLIYIIKEKRFLLNFADQRHVLIYLSFYLINLISLFYSTDKNSGLFNLEKLLSFLVLPIVIPTLPKWNVKKIDYALWIFVLGTLIASWFCIGNALNHSISVVDGKFIFDPSPWKVSDSLYKLIISGHSYFSYGYLSVFHHPGYFSNFILFSIIIVFVKKNLVFNFKLLKISLLLFFYCMLFLLQSRTQLAIGFLVLVYILFTLIRKYRPAFKYGIILLFFVLGTVFLISNSRISKTIDSFGLTNPNKVNDRIVTWNASFTLIKNKPFFGYGVGDYHNELKTQYLLQNQNTIFNKSLNSHSQYLETLGETGLIGFGILLLLFLISARNAIKTGNILLLWLVIITSITCLVESYFLRQAGVVFFCWFSLLLFDVGKRGGV